MLQILEDSDTVVVYTDGSYFYNDNGYGGAACFFAEHSLYNVQQYFDSTRFGPCSPLRTEVFGVILACTQAIHMGIKRLVIKLDCLNCIILLRVIIDATEPLRNEYREDPLLVQWWRCLQRIHVELEHMHGHLLRDEPPPSVVDSEMEMDTDKVKEHPQKEVHTGKRKQLLDLFFQGSLESQPQSASEIKIKREKQRKKLAQLSSYSINKIDVVNNSFVDTMAKHAALNGKKDHLRHEMNRLNPIYHPWKNSPTMYLVPGSWLQQQFCALLKNPVWNNEQVEILKVLVERQEKEACCSMNHTSKILFSEFKPANKHVDVSSTSWQSLQIFWNHNPRLLTSLHDSIKPLFSQCQ